MAAAGMGNAPGREEGKDGTKGTEGTDKERDELERLADGALMSKYTEEIRCP